MSLPVRLLLFTLLLSVSACGFQPMYGKKPADVSSAASAGVSVDKLSGSKAKHQFWIALEDKLNPGGKVPSDPEYRLVVTLDSSVTAIGVAIDGTVSRYNVTLTSSYVLKDRKTDATITSGTLRHVGSYNNRINEYFSTYISSEDAMERGVAALSETYRQRLAPFLSGQRSSQRADESVKENAL